MKADTVFRIASMTKIATSVAVMMLDEAGKLSVDDPVEKHLPEFRGQKLLQKLPAKPARSRATRRSSWSSRRARSPSRI